MTGRLHPDDVEAIARRVVELYAAHAEEAIARRVVEAYAEVRPARPALVDAVALAHELGMSRAWVYEHRTALGAVTIGSGPKARLRINLEVALAAFSRLEDEPRASARQPVKQPPKRRRPSTSSVPLLPIAEGRTR